MNEDYTSAGFDGFLSRSIDSNPMQNLDSQGPSSMSVPFDRTQTTGPLGDTIRIGNILLDGRNGRIIMSDGSNDVLLIGEDF